MAETDSDSGTVTPPAGADEGLPRWPTYPRHAQMFPTLTAAEIARIRRFGSVHRYADGEALFETGRQAPVGDVRSGSVKRVGSAIGEGAQVVASIHNFLSLASSPTA